VTAARPATVSSEDQWQERGRRAAQAVAQVASAIVVGADPERAARVAVGIARAESATRRVALGDLVGDLGPLYAIAGGEDGFGLADCFREGRSLNEVAREAPDCPALFILPAGTPPIGARDMLTHVRWPRLVNGFAESGALLLLVAPLDAPGLETLAAATGGVVAVGVPAHRVRAFHVLASVDAPGATVPHLRPARGARPWRRVAVAIATVAGVLGWLVWSRRAPAPPLGAAARAAGLVTPTPSVLHPPAPPETQDALARAETVEVRTRVNPTDSLRAATFAVEVVAANTSAGANSFVRDGRDLPLPASTVAPVQSGVGTLWYRLIVGAWRSRDGADSLLAALRTRKVVEPGAGAVVRVPYAMLLVEGLDPSRAADAVGAWRTRGIPAYALLQDDGTARVFAGAFETPAQAASLAASLRDAGVTPLVAYRTGRSF